MNAAFVAMLVISMVCAALNGGVDALAQALVRAGDDAIAAVLALLGGFMFFGGLVEMFNRAGLSAFITRLLRKPLRWLLGGGVGDEATGYAAMNLAANMLGMGNAATPLGLKAAKLLGEHADGKASAALCVFLVVNATSVQLFPASVVALRVAAGSADATAIVLPSLAASAVSTAAGVIICKIVEAAGR